MMKDNCFVIVAITCSYSSRTLHQFIVASSPVLQMSETDNLCVMSNCFLSSGPEKQVGFSLVPCVGSSGNADYWGSGSYK